MSYHANEMAEERNTRREQWGLSCVVPEAHHTGCNDIDCCKTSKEHQQRGRLYDLSHSEEIVDNNLDVL